MATLETLCQWYESSIEATHESRKLSERDRDYVDSKQLTADELAALKKRKQPPVVINRLKPKLNYLLGSERQQRTDPKAFPRTPQDDGASEAATDAIRYVCDKNDYAVMRSRVFENMVVEGFGGAIIEASNKGKTVEISIRQIPWDRLFYDKHSREPDFSDAKYLGIVAWLDEDDGVAMYGDVFKAVAENSYDHGKDDATYDDKPYLSWTDEKRKRVKVCETYYREGGKWMTCVYTKGGFIIEPKPSSYVDEDDTPTNPIEIMSAYVDRENQRYGALRELIGPQDEINKRRSKALHLLNTRQVVAERGAVDNINQARNELARPDGIVEVNPGMKFEIIPTSEMAMGNMNLLQEAKSEIDSIGNNAALQGKQGAQSGRELIARQQAGQVELGPLYDNLRQFNKAVYRQIWYRIKQFWKEETWIRVTDDEKKLRYVGLNQPTTQGELEAEKIAGQNLPPEQKQQMVQQLAMNPMSQMPAVRNDVSRMDMDIIIEDVPDTVNIQGEQFELLAQMYQSAPDRIPLELVIEASSLRNKERLLEAIKGSSPEAQAANAERQAVGKSQLDKTNSETEKNLAQAQKSRADAVKAVSDAAHAAMMPMNGQAVAGIPGEPRTK